MKAAILSGGGSEKMSGPGEARSGGTSPQSGPRTALPGDRQSAPGVNRMASRPSGERDHYRLFGLSPTASAEVIVEAYRRLARRYHPDAATEESASSEMFKRITESYGVLSDPRERRDYDRRRSKETKPEWFARESVAPSNIGRPSTAAASGRRSPAERPPTSTPSWPSRRKRRATAACSTSRLRSRRGAGAAPGKAGSPMQSAATAMDWANFKIGAGCASLCPAE